MPKIPFGPIITSTASLILCAMDTRNQSAWFGLPRGSDADCAAVTGCTLNFEYELRFFCQRGAYLIGLPPPLLAVVARM
jgi:hypothetical protein